MGTFSTEFAREGPRRNPTQLPSPFAAELMAVARVLSSFGNLDSDREAFSKLQIFSTTRRCGPARNGAVHRTADTGARA